MAFDESGTLTVRTYGANAFPIEGATVRIRGAAEENRFVEYSVITDEDGVTVPVVLPAPDRSNSLSPNGVGASYAPYDVEIIKDGYYTKKIYGVAIFSGVGAFLPVNMIPFTSSEMGGRYPEGNIDATITQDLD